MSEVEQLRRQLADLRGDIQLIEAAILAYDADRRETYDFLVSVVRSAAAKVRQ